MLTRLFSALLYYHFTFFAIALALLGMGASGVYVYVRAERFPAAAVGDQMARYAQLFGVATIVALVYLLASPASIVTDSTESTRFTSAALVQLVFLNLLTMLPFFFAGVVVSLAVSRFSGQIDRVYFYDLLGAGLAALLVGVLIGWMGGPALVLLVALLASASALLFSTSPRRRAVAATLCFGGLFVLGLQTRLFAVPSAKAVDRGRIVFEGWNTLSRITVERLLDGMLDIKIDACASTAITPAREEHTNRWRRQVTALGYSVAPAGAESALIIGPGGGRDVVFALASGARRVTAVEVNPLIGERIMRRLFPEASGRLYFDPRVRLEIDEGRSFVRRSPERYDVIQASMVDTWAATAAGAFALTENTLYTLEAFEDYYSHLTDDGVLTMTRWHRKADPETTRLVLLAAGALERRGVPPGRTRRQLILATKDTVGTLLAKRTPFTADELRRIEAACERGRFEIALGPQTDGTSPLEQLVDAGAWSAAARAYEQNVLPPRDDQPFFFYFVKPSELWSIPGQLRAAQLRKPAVWLLLATATILTLLTALFIYLPLALTRLAELPGNATTPGCRLRRSVALGFFAAIGLAFMVVEMGLMQRLSLFLGHPSYALVVVLFSILVASALGARLSRRVSEQRAGDALLAAGGAIAALSLAAALVLPPVLRSQVGLPLAARVLIAGLAVSVFGLLMGLLLPLGVRLVSRSDARILPWAWGLNGGMSVTGTVVATIVAIHWGFTATLCVGALLYVVAGAAGLSLERMARPASSSD